MAEWEHLLHEGKFTLISRVTWRQVCNFRVMTVRAALASKIFLDQTGKIATLAVDYSQRCNCVLSGWQKQRKSQRSQCNCFPCCLLASVLWLSLSHFFPIYRVRAVYKQPNGTNWVHQHFSQCIQQNIRLYCIYIWKGIRVEPLPAPLMRSQIARYKILKKYTHTHSDKENIHKKKTNPHQYAVFCSQLHLKKMKWKMTRNCSKCSMMISVRWKQKS